MIWFEIWDYFPLPSDNLKKVIISNELSQCLKKSVLPEEYSFFSEEF